MDRGNLVDDWQMELGGREGGVDLGDGDKWVISGTRKTKKWKKGRWIQVVGWGEVEGDDGDSEKGNKQENKSYQP